MTPLSRRSFMGAAVLAPGLAAVGAKGDGATDDTGALQEAIDKGGVLVLEPGTYRITKPLVLDTRKRGYVGIRGAQGAARLVMAGAGAAVQVIGDHHGTANPGSVADHTWERERFPVLAGFEILGEHAEADGIEIERTMQCTVDGVLVRRCRHGIHLITRNRNPIVANCHIYECRDSGIFMDDCNLHQFIIIGNHISYCARAGIRQLNGDVHNVHITGNDIEYNSGSEAGQSGEIVLENPDHGMISEYTIASNTIQARPENPGANIVIDRRDDDASVGCFSITGNVLGSRDINVLARNARRGLTVTGNTIYCGKTRNLHMAQCARVIVANNTILESSADFGDQGGVRFEACYDSMFQGNILSAKQAGSAEAGGDLHLVDCRDMQVLGNQMTRPHHRGLVLEGCRRCQVANNTIARGEEAAPYRVAIALTGGSRENHIRHNSLAPGSDGVVTGADDKNLVDGNIPWA